MAGRFSYSSPESRYGGTPWFKVGDVDVGTAVLITGACVLSMFVWAASRSLWSNLAFVSPFVRSGEIWRLVTWPIAEEPGFFAVISIAFFWSFGQTIEGLFGRTKFLIWVLAVTIVPALVVTFAGLASSSLDAAEFGLGPLIGTRTWGGLIGISANPSMVDGGFLAVPFFRFYDTDGTWSVENEGVAPDIEVELDPIQANAGRDSQLERAISEILSQLERFKSPVKDQAPPYPTELGK